MADIIKAVITSLLSTNNVDKTNWKPKALYTIVILLVCCFLGAGYMVLEASLKTFGSANARALDANKELIKTKDAHIKQLENNAFLLTESLKDSEKVAQIYLDNYTDQQVRLSQVVNELNITLVDKDRLKVTVGELRKELLAKDKELELLRRLAGQCEVKTKTH